MTPTVTAARGADVFIAVTRDGRIADPLAWGRLERRLPAATDCFVFCHGWLYDTTEARQEAARFFALLDGALAPLGDRFGREHLGPLWRKLASAPRLHLVGHSFGAKLLTSAVLGGACSQSLTLLLAAFSAFAFAGDVPGYRRPGFYHRVLTERRVDGPVVVLRSERDTALGALYSPLTTSGQVDRHPGRARHRHPAPTPHTPRRTRRGDVLATSALGAVGARGVGAPELTQLPRCRAREGEFWGLRAV